MTSEFPVTMAEHQLDRKGAWSRIVLASHFKLQKTFVLRHDGIHTHRGTL